MGHGGDGDGQVVGGRGGANAWMWWHWSNDTRERNQKEVVIMRPARTTGRDNKEDLDESQAWGRTTDTYTILMPRKAGRIRPTCEHGFRDSCLGHGQYNV